MVSLLRQSQYRAYSAARQTVSKTRQVVMLYDGAIRFIQQARRAIEERRYEDRYKLLTKASEILVGLQGSLDFQHGEAVAQQLYDFYSYMDAQLMAIHRSNSVAACDEAIESLKAMRNEWHRIDTLREREEAAASAPHIAPAAEEEEADAPQDAPRDAAVPPAPPPPSGVQLSA